MKKYILIAIIPFIALIVSQTKWPIKGGYGALSDVTGPGTVPLGGMIAIMKSIPSAWQPGTTGVEKDGFQLADGVAFNAGCTLTGSTPNMTNNFLKGNTASSGSAGGSASYNLTSANMPSGVYSGTTSKDQWNANQNNHNHFISSSDATSGTVISNSNTLSREYTGDADRNYTLTGSGTGATLGLSQGKTATWTAVNASVTISGGSADPTDVDTVPPYIETVWVIRCK